MNEHGKPGHPHGAMRRKDREITERKLIDEIISGEKVMHLALADNGIPFVVPLFYAYDGGALYFHSAKAGTKIEIIKRNPSVCFEIFTGYGIIESDTACDFEAKHRTVIGHGKAAFVTDEAEKKRAIDMIVARFTEKKFEYPAANFSVTTVVKITVENVKGKMHGF
jgi:nitroimidazol reductase NimA-like FMN-containing flavoprotein (pyridoxamine 5'-phosphate oxidase superfamily)